MKSSNIFKTSCHKKIIAYIPFLILAILSISNFAMAQKVFVVNSNNPLKNFTASSKNESHPFFIDIDGDNDLDCFIGEYNNGKQSKIYYYRNDGNNRNPIFKNITGAGNPLSAVNANTISIPCFIDIDSDGDYDCFVSDGITGAVMYYENTGSRTRPQFQKQSAAFNPLSMIKFSASGIANIAFADVDEDGDYDCLVTDEEGDENYFKNTGTSLAPAFVHVANTNDPFKFLEADNGIYNISFYDWNKDGLTDLFVNTTYYKNTGSKEMIRFAKSNYDEPVFHNSIAQKYSYTPLRWVDLNNDGNTEVFQGSAHGSVIYQTLSNSDNTSSLATAAALPSLRVFPNPSKQEFILSISKSAATESILRVTDVQGKLLLTQFINEGTFKFGKDLNAGIYFVQVMQNNNVVFSQKIIKEQ